MKQPDTKRRIKSLTADERGTVLIFSYLVLTVLFTLSAGFALSTTNELNHSSRYRDESVAFWLAEAGIHRFMQNPALLDAGPQTIYFGNDFVNLSKDDTGSSRLVTASGSANGISRSLQIEYPPNPPVLFDNTISTGGDLDLFAFFAGLDVNDKTRISGDYHKFGLAIGQFEDKVTGVDSTSTTLAYPDTDNNGTPDEFNDFVEFNRNIIAGYPADEVVYLTRGPTDPAIEVWPDASLVGKKILYVEGPDPGSGDVEILFDATWAAEQNLTIISTGSVSYIQPLQNPSSDSQLNMISWDTYSEASILYSAHKGVTYTHSNADFGSIVSFSHTSGNLVANDTITFVLGASWKRFDFESPIDDTGLLPPGFEGLLSSGGGGFASTPTEWKEI